MAADRLRKLDSIQQVARTDGDASGKGSQRFGLSDERGNGVSAVNGLTHQFRSDSTGCAEEQ